MSPVAALMAATAPLVFVGERDLLHLPSADEVRVQPVERTGNEEGWPFTVARGHLSCVWSAGQRVVTFFAEAGDGEPGAPPRGVILSMDPIQLTLFNIGNNDLFEPVAEVADRIRQVAPLHAVGMRLCDQPPGAAVGHGEL